MSVFVIAHVTVSDPSWIEDYTPAVQAQVESHGGRYLARATEIEHIEGSGAVPSAAVIMEFPDAERAKAWYASPEYQPYLKARQAGATADFFLVDAL